MALSLSSEALDALLSEQAFRRHGSTWVRERGLFAEVVDLQRGRSVDGITVNVALMHGPTFAIAWGRPPQFPPREPDCIVRSRIGLLLDGRDRWWRPDDARAVGEMTEAVASAALPFLTGFQDIEDLEQWLDRSPTNRYPPEALYRAAVKHQLGNDSEARNIVERLLDRTTSEPWRDCIAKVAASLA